MAAAFRLACKPTHIPHLPEGRTMLKKILVINSSPVPGGVTETLADAFIEGARKKGHMINKINVRLMDLKYCTGCRKCAAKKGHPCVLKDDMKEIYRDYDMADVVVLAVPLYSRMLNAQMMTVLNRLYAVAAVNDFKPEDKDIYLIAISEETGVGFDMAVSYYKHWIEKKGLNDRGILLAGGMSRAEDLQDTDLVAQAMRLGMSV